MGASDPDSCKKDGVSSASIFKYWTKFGGMDASLTESIKDLEEEKCALKKMHAEKRLKSKITK